MDKFDADSYDPPNETEPPAEDDFDGLVAFYERTGTMAVNTIGPPIDRPIIPRRRPDRLRDFNFIPGEASDTGRAAEPDDPEAERIQQEFLEMLDDRLRRR